MLKFLTYNNAVPIAISLVLLGAGGAFAATNPEAIYSTQEKVVSIDNTFLVNRDLSSYSPRVEITGVTEDTEMYYVAYNFYTIDLQDGVWRDVTKNQTMNVSKADLGQYRDLGLYVTEQLKQLTDRELSYLVEVQGIERKNVTHKVVATAYGGLVGKFLDTSTEELPGYTPVVTPPPPVQVASVGASQQNTGQITPTVSSGNPTMTMQILGNSPAQIEQRSSYLDLGVVASDGHNSVIRIETYLDGIKVDQVQINTTATSTHTIRYVALDPQDNSLSGERTVIVYDPTVGQPVPQDQVRSGVTVGASVTPVFAPTNTTPSTTQTTQTTQDATINTTNSTSTPTSTSTSSQTASSTNQSTAISTTESTATTTPTTTTTSTQVSTGSTSSTATTTTSTNTSSTSATSTSESTPTATTSATTSTSSSATTTPTQNATSTSQAQ